MKRIFFSSALILLFIIGCNAEEKVEITDEMTDNNRKPPADIPLTYLALGDSYTIGEGVPENGRFPVQLKDNLENSGVKLSRVQIIARTGWTTDELSKAMDASEFDESYGLITLLIGVNNQYRGRTPESYQPEFSALLKRAIALAGGDTARVIVISIPDWGVTPFAANRDRQKIAAEIDAYNHINREEARKAGVAWVDVTEISRRAATQPELIAPDQLHPSTLMYKSWVDDMFPYAKKVFSE
jgi:lysophospholipase L1-like esterase